MSPAKTAIQKLDKLCMRGVTERERKSERRDRQRTDRERFDVSLSAPKLK
jgi:hypothetical protein